jgi:ATP-dependent DNA ligase
MAKAMPVPAPMEALLATELPQGEGWQYEPKWDGFRCLARRDGEEVTLTSKSGKPLARYFPDVVEILKGTRSKYFLLDGELIIPVGDALSFEALQLRLHPAESRVRKLAAQSPAELMLFDLLELNGTALTSLPLADRREMLERFFRDNDVPGLHLSPVTRNRNIALGWLSRSGGALDGVIAKRTDLMFLFGVAETADDAVGGTLLLDLDHRPLARAVGQLGSLLLGLYDDQGLLDHVGFTSAIPTKERAKLTADLERLVAPPGFSGSKPGGPSRWNTERTGQWQPLRPELVVEVKYDQVTARRFRHGTGFVRWRPDKDPRQCTFQQLAPELRPSELKELFGQ